MNKYIFIAFLSIFLTACQDRYRYPCQDPKNINSEECSVQNCEVTKECPKNKIEGE